MAKIEDAAKIYEELTNKVISLREVIHKKNCEISEMDGLLKSSAEEIRILRADKLKAESSTASNSKALEEVAGKYKLSQERISELSETISKKERELIALKDEHERCESAFAKVNQILREERALSEKRHLDCGLLAKENDELRKKLAELEKKESFMEEAITQAVTKAETKEPEEDVKYELHLDMGRKERIYQTIVDATKENVIEPTTELCDKNDVQLSEVYHVCSILTRKLCKGRQTYLTERSDGRTFKLDVPFSVLLTAIRDL